ncbi:MAG: hypothetical protein GY868_07860 [Deltaproteobacteria bacterium]|nr:hypothetical protein [Deltaproteobacteria bacterium]
MDKQLLQQIVETFGTENLTAQGEIYAKVLLHPDNSIAVYFINAHEISEQLQQRSYEWDPRLHAWVKLVKTIAEVQAETRGYPVTAAALSAIH